MSKIYVGKALRTKTSRFECGDPNKVTEYSFVQGEIYEIENEDHGKKLTDPLTNTLELIEIKEA